MPRVSLAVLAATLATAGAAQAQTDYGGQGHPSPGGYGPPAASQASPGYADDDRYGDDRAPPSMNGQGAPGAYAGGEQGPPDLARDLGLRADQRAALQAYQQATEPSEAEQRQMQADEQRLAAMTTPQRLDFAAAQMRRDQATFAQRADAVRRFYAQLTPEQQRRFDMLTGPGAGGGMGGDSAEEGAAPPPR